jgi:hypothetical protein
MSVVIDVIATGAPLAISLGLTCYFLHLLRTTKRNSAAALALLGNVGQKLSIIQADLEGIHARLDSHSEKLEAIHTAKKVAAA